VLVHLFLTITFGGFALMLGVLTVMRALYGFGLCAEPPANDGAAIQTRGHGL
jgi:hypothetical protein